MTRTELIREDGIGDLRDAWAALAEENARPFCHPDWMMAWWRHVAPRDAVLSAVVVSDGEETIGVAPLYSRPDARGPLRLRLLGTGTFLRAEPLARSGREHDVARAVIERLNDGSTPGLVTFEGVPAGSEWPELFHRNWTQDRASKMYQEWSIPAPVLSLEGRTFDDWFASKSSNFRQQMRRGRRKLEHAGALFRMSRDAEELQRDLRSFAALHHARWDPRGGSRALTPKVETMLAEAAPGMVSSGALRLWSLEVDGRVVSSHLFLAAGGEVAYWLGGFDDRWADHKPSMHVLLEAIEHASRAGDKRVDLGGGGQDYKYRLADGSETLTWSTIVPPGIRHQATRLGLSTVRARRKLLSRLSPKTQARLRRLVRRA